jgi:hypothetical protein
MFVASRSQADPKLRFTTTLADGRVGWKTVVDRPTFEGAADVDLQTRRFGDSQMRPDNRGVSCQAMSRLFDKGRSKSSPAARPQDQQKGSFWHDPSNALQTPCIREDCSDAFRAQTPFRRPSNAHFHTLAFKRPSNALPFRVQTPFKRRHPHPPIPPYATREGSKPRAPRNAEFDNSSSDPKAPAPPANPSKNRA